VHADKYCRMEENRRTTFLFLFLTIALSGIGTVFRKVGVDKMPNPLQFQMLAAIVYMALGIIAGLSFYLSSGPKTPWCGSGITINILSLLFNAAAGLAFMKLIGLSNNVGLMSSLTSLNVIITLFLSAIFLHETVNTKSLIGITLMLLGAFIASKN